MRVTGGRWGGRRLRSPPRGVRPSADRVREALFARLGDLGGCAVLDLYAGTGALGIEALSRGAECVVFVERAAAAAAVLRRNLAALEAGPAARLLRADVAVALRRLAREGARFDCVLADPPYAEAGLAGPLGLLVSEALLAPGATLVVERSRRHPVPAIAGLALRDTRRYGDTTLEWLGLAEAGPADSGVPQP